jgi:membrane-associated protein
MHVVSQALDFVLHLNKHLNGIVADYGVWTYLILFLILFAETGLVVTPFLPGDSLLFAAGALAATEGSPLNIVLLYIIFFCGALTGDNTNYFFGKFLGPRVVKSGKLLKQKHLDKTHAFFEKYGGKTIIMARFVPIVRTFAPFVAGIGAMTYPRFLAYSIGGAILWVGVCVTAGYFFGLHPFVQKNFSVVILAIIAISILPAVYEIIKHRREAKHLTETEPSQS